MGSCNSGSRTPLSIGALSVDPQPLALHDVSDVAGPPEYELNADRLGLAQEPVTGLINESTRHPLDVEGLVFIDVHARCKHQHKFRVHCVLAISALDNSLVRLPSPAMRTVVPIHASPVNRSKAHLPNQSPRGCQYSTCPSVKKGIN
jgi:hypothetical protein